LVEGKGSPSISTGNQKPDPAPGFWFPFNRETGKGLPRHLRAAAETLELRYQDRCYTWASTKLLAQDHGLRTERGWQKLDTQLIAAGWLKTFTLRQGNKKKTIRVALKRLHQGRGVFDEASGCWECLVKDARARATRQGELGLCAECAAGSPRTPVPKSTNSSSKSRRTPVRSLSPRLPYRDFEEEKGEEEKSETTTTTSCGSARPPAREPSPVRSSSSNLSSPFSSEPEKTLSVDQPLIASDELAEFDAWADELSLSTERRRDFLAGCGPHGPRLGTACLKFAKKRAKHNPHRFAETARDGWRRKLAARELTLGDVEAEVGPVTLSNERGRQREADHAEIEASIAARPSLAVARSNPKAEHIATPDEIAYLRACTEAVRRGAPLPEPAAKTGNRQDRPREAVGWREDGSTVPTPEDSSGDDSDPFAGISARARGPPIGPGTA